MKEIVDVFAAAGRGLAAAHQAGMVHRDFKPANTIVGEDGRVRVLDFGLARSLDDVDNESKRITPPQIKSRRIVSSTDDALAGTPAYMAPEQHRGKLANEKSDQFSYCVLLYESLYRTRPFSDITEDRARHRDEWKSPWLETR